MPTWLLDTLAATPAFIWMFVGLGLPWALVLLPRRDWHDRPLVGVVMLAAGPSLMTAWMLVLGWAGGASETRLIRPDTVLMGSVVIAALGVLLALRKRGQVVDAPERRPLAFDEKLMIGLLIAALVIRWFDAAYWPFTAYDALWVYGYQGRLYALLGYIPQSIDYYPQFLSLQYTYGQLFTGVINDHSARAGLMFLQWGSILATYVLGSQLFTRRVGIFAAVLWGLYPHLADWSRFGDLEVPVTFLFTLAAAFFLMSWTNQTPRRHYALLAGLAFGAAMWTKPTAGGFVYGVLLLVVLAFIQARGNWTIFRPRFETAVLTGLASIPLGAVWYVRNGLLGHEVITLPPGFWQSLAQRSGVEFGWPLLALVALLGYLYLSDQPARPPRRPVVLGVALILVALIPSILWLHPLGSTDWLSRFAGVPSLLVVIYGLWEWGALAAGCTLLVVTLARFARQHWTADQLATARRLTWVLLLALPYFITWFFSYSYHYRLSFAIVPLLLLPTAVIVGYWRGRAGISRRVYAAALVIAALPGVVNALYDVNAGWSWLFTNQLPDDHAKYTSGNAALMNLVDGLQVYLDEGRQPPMSVIAPGVKRLPFFFPLENIDVRDEAVPASLDAAAGLVYYVDSSPEGRGAVERIPPLSNGFLAALGRLDLMRPAWGYDDGIFRYQAYELHLDRRFIKPVQNAPTPEGDVIFGGFARLLAHDIGANTFWPGRKVVMHLYWEVLAPPDDDYMVFVHLRDANGAIVAQWDGPVAPTADGLFYDTTLLWQPKTFIVDERTLIVPEGTVLEPGAGYTLVVGMYPLSDQTNRVEILVNGKPWGTEYRLNEALSGAVAEE